MKLIAAENKPSQTTGNISESKEVRDLSKQVKKDPDPEVSKKPADPKPIVSLPEQTGAIKYKKDYAVWY